MSADYSKLKAVLDAAYSQSVNGKGKARHQRGEVAFERQPILEIGRMVGPGFALGQVMKKAQEAGGMVSRSDYDSAMAELLGAIVYAASAVVLISETQKLAQDEPVVATRAPASRNPLTDAMRAVDAAVTPGAR